MSNPPGFLKTNKELLFLIFLVTGCWKLNLNDMATMAKFPPPSMGGVRPVRLWRGEGELSTLN